MLEECACGVVSDIVWVAILPRGALALYVGLRYGMRIYFVTDKLFGFYRKGTRARTIHAHLRSLLII